MRILFVFGNAYRKKGSNANIAWIMIERLKRNNDVYIVTDDYIINEENQGLPFLRSKKENNIYYYSIRPIFKYESIVLRLVRDENWTERSAQEKILYALKNPYIIFWRIVRFMQQILYIVFGHDELEDGYLKGIKRMDKMYHFDRIIAVSCPFSAARALSRARVQGKKILYQLDPYHTNFYTKNHRKALMEEKSVLRNIDLAVMTDLIYKENQTNQLSVYKDKMHWINYPNIRDLRSKYNGNGYFDKKKINCCFIGLFYQEIRNPAFMLDVFSHISSKDIVLHLIGGGCESVVMGYKKIMGERLQIHGWKSLDVSLEFMMQADILVSLNNTIRNQVPGKIFDYISTGKPILNFCYLRDCQSLEYLSKYPIVMNVFYKSAIQINSIEKFINDFNGKAIPYETIRELYNDYTADVAGGKFEKLVEMLSM